MNNQFAKSAYTSFVIWGMLSSMSATVCTLVDALLVGNLVGSNGLAVVNISTPVFLVFALVGLTIGIGANVRVGRLLGASDVQEANRTFHAETAVSLGIGVLFLLVPVFFREPFLRFLGVTDELFGLASQYLTVVMYSAPIFVFYNMLSISVRTDSDPKLAAFASGVVIVTNLSLDLLFMKVFAWGIIGASASLCIAELAGTVVLMTHFFKKRSLLRLGFAKPKRGDVRGFIFNGFGMGSAYVFQALVMLVFNSLLLRNGGESGVSYVAIFGVLYTVSLIPFAIYDGASNALSTVVSIFLGELDTKSAQNVLRYGLTLVVAAGLVISTICAIFADRVAVLFGLTGKSILDIAEPAIRIFAASTVFTGINTLITAYWQVIGRARLAALMSVLRNCLLMLAIGFLFIGRLAINGLSLTYVCTEALCAAFMLVIMRFGSSRAYLDKHYCQTGRFFENHYIIQKESMEQIAADLSRICEEWEIDPKRSFMVNLIVEELLLNIIKFGLEEKGKERYINVKLLEKGENYGLRIRDNVNTYNPFESDGDDIDNGVLTLITKKTKSYYYQRKLVFNYLFLEV